MSQNSTPSPSPDTRGRLTDTQWMKFLKALDANFVFLFGKQSAGKSAVLASLIHTGIVAEYGAKLTFRKTIHVMDTSSAQPAVEAALTDLKEQSDLTFDALAECFRWDGKTRQSSGFLPKRTEKGPPLLVGGTIHPVSRATSCPIVFLEVAGETLGKLGERGSALPMEMDVYFRARGISMIFMLIVPWHDAAEDDEMVARFIDYVAGLNPGHDSARFILLITKWDSNAKGKQRTAKQLVENEMKQTWSRIRSSQNIVAEFSIGSVELCETSEPDEPVAGGFKKEPFVQVLDGSYTTKLWTSIYESFSPQRLKKPGWLARLRDL